MLRRSCRQRLTGLTALGLACALLLSACTAGLPSSAPRTEPPAESADSPPSPSPAAVYPDGVVISELMAKNKTTLDDGSGLFPDWIELHNTGSESVDLSGWTLTDREDRGKARFPKLLLGPDEYLLIFAGKDHKAREGELLAPFALSEGETVFLLDPNGEVKASAAIGLAETDVSLIRGDAGDYLPCSCPTPGFPNTREGCAAFRLSREGASPLVINEVLVKNETLLPSYLFGTDDIVELKNISDEPVQLGAYSISDKNTARRVALPDKTLEPGELFLIFCCGEERDSKEKRFYAPIALDALEERLYLYGPDGLPADYMLLRDIPSGGSYGRTGSGDGPAYFVLPTPGEENGEGIRFVSARPLVDTEPGVYTDAQRLTVTLSAAETLPSSDGGSAPRIYYTLDGSRPDESSALYTGPIDIDATTILRAVAVEEDALPGPVGTYPYLLGISHSLPVLHLTADNPRLFYQNYSNVNKSPQPANAALFDGEHSFNWDGLLRIRGHTSLSLPKKSLGMFFPDSVAGPLRADVFGNGVTVFSDLSIRAGQDNLKTLFRTELVQDLVLESSEHLMVQASKFCVVYINGEYWGLYALKEDMGRRYYAEHRHVSVDSVTVLEGEVARNSDFYRDVIRFADENDMRDPDNYAQICETIDVDSFIDWIIFEGYTGNTDTLNNIFFFRSTEDDGLWRWGLLDLDWSFQNPEMDYRVIMNCETNAGYQMYQLMMALFENDGFKARFLRRFGELNRTTLSNAHVLEAIDRYAELLEPEIEQDGKLRSSSYRSWLHFVDELRNFIIENDWENHNVSQIALFLKMKEEDVRAAMAAD